MTILRQPDTEAKQTKWIGPNGRLLALDFGVRRDEVPVWLTERLRAYAKRFDWGDTCVDPWEILRRISPSVVWRGGWGVATMANGMDVFMSDAIDSTRHCDVDAVADDLDVSYAWCPDGRFAFAERAAIWRER